MKTKLSFHLLVVSSLLLAALPAPAAKAAAAAPADLLQFTAGGHALGFAASGMYAASGSHALHVDFVGANSVRPQVSGQDNASPGGRAAALSQVTYTDLWDGIRLAYTAEAGSLYTTTYTLAPGANPADIRLRYNAPLSLNKDGSLGIAFETGSMTESALVAWQEINGRRVTVEAAFKVSGEEVSFALGAYNPNYTLTIDPSLIWNSFLGGTASDDYAYSVAVDSNSNVFVTGTSSTTWGDPARAFTGGKDAYVAELNSTGSLVWSTFLGGSGDDTGYGITLDASGYLYVVGESTATWGAAPVRAYTGGTDAFVAKLNASNGAFAWNIFLGASGNDEGRGIAYGSGYVFVTGDSVAAWGCLNASLPPCTVPPFSGSSDAYVAELIASSGVLYSNIFLGGTLPDYGRGVAVQGSETSMKIFVTGSSYGSWSCASPCTQRGYTAGVDAFVASFYLIYAELTLSWNSFLGGSGDDYGNGIAVDASGNTYVTGFSNASWGSPTRSYTGPTGWDGFAAKLSSSGTLQWNTFLGGDNFDYGNGIAVDADGANVYVTGRSKAAWTCTDTPCTGLAYTGDYDAFAAKINASTGILAGNTFLGGSGEDIGYGIAVGADGHVYMAGNSGTTWSCSPTACTVRYYTGGQDAFAVKLESNIALDNWNTFLGGGGEDFGYAISVDGSGNVYVTGYSEAPWSCSPVACTQRAYASGGDAFVAKLDASGALLWNTFLGSNHYDQGLGIAVDVSGNVYVTGWGKAAWGSPTRPYTGGWEAFVARLDSSGVLVWNTFLGGNGIDQGYGIGLDGSGNIYVAGYSNLAWGCSPACTARAYAGNGDAFAAKLAASSGALIWNSFLGSDDYDQGTGIAVDGGGNAYVTGLSYAPWSCSPAACTQLAYTGGRDAFAAKLDSSGALIWNSFLGGNGYDEGQGIAVDGSGNVYVTGNSNTSWGSPKSNFTSGQNGFAAKLNPSGGLTWNTFLGGMNSGDGQGIAVDGSGNVYVSGFSTATWGSPERAYAGGGDTFAARFNASTGALTWNTFLGGSGWDEGFGIAVDGSGDVYVTGNSYANWGSPVRAFAGSSDASATKLDPTPPRVVSSLRLDPNPTNAPSVRFTVNFNETVTGVDAADFLLTPSGISGAAVSLVSGVSGSSVYTVTVSTGSGTGTLRLDVTDNDTILDAVGNRLGGLGTVNGNYNGGEIYSVRPPCYALSRAYSGSGGVPTASPINSNSCAGGHYVAGEVITLTASPASGWAVGSWSGTSNNSSTSITNSVIMPSGSQTVTANYTLTNTAPVANAQSVTTDEDTAKAITLTGSDADGDPLTYSVVAGPSHGTLSGTAPALTYTPAANYNGSDSFTFKANDGTLDSATTTVSITVTAVNDAPIIAEGASTNVTMSEDGSPTPFSLTLHATDMDGGDTLTWSISTPASHGTASAIGTGISKAISYTPALHYTGPDSFVVQVSDGNGGTDTITVHVTITAVEPIPFTIFLPLILR